MQINWLLIANLAWNVAVLAIVVYFIYRIEKIFIKKFMFEALDEFDKRINQRNATTRSNEIKAKYGW